MKTVHRQVLLDIFKLMDVTLMAAAFIVADILAHPPYDPAHIVSILQARFSVFNGLLGVGMLLAFHLTFLWLGAYNSKRFTSLYEEFVLVLKASVFGLAIILVMDRIYSFNFINIQFLHLFLGLSLIFLVASRILLRYALGFLRVNGRNLRFVLIVGTGNRALQYARYIQTNPHMGYLVKGFVDDTWHGDAHNRAGLPGIVADFDSFGDYLRDNVVDEILISLPIKTYYQHMNQIASAAEEQGVIVRMSTDLFNLKLARPKVEHIGDELLITMVAGGMYRRMVILKSVFDFLSASLLFIALLPVMIAAALAIKMTSRGPVFFLQPRVGMNKRTFKVIKFRTMVVDAEKKLKELQHLNDREESAAFKMKNDPRITPVGRILRKFSVDELPQLINVIKGDMSLVGPRPLTLSDFNAFKKDWQRRRFSVKPGITCIWQVSGRDNIPFDRWMEMDMEYIDQWNIWLDLKILLKTLPVSVFGVGAS